MNRFIQKTRKPNRKIVVVVAFLLIIVFLLFQIQSVSNTLSKKTRVTLPTFSKIEDILSEQQAECAASSSYVQLLNEKLDHSVVSNIGPYVQIGGGELYWRWLIDEPYLGYDSQSGIDGSIQGGTKLNMINDTSLFKKNVEPIILASGFIKDQLNTDENDGKYAYTKGNLLLEIYFWRDDVPNPAVTKIRGFCAVRDSKSEALYADLLTSKQVITNVDKVNGVDSINKTSIAIAGEYGNGVVGIGTGDTELWFHKQGVVWSKIFEGQDYPPCQLLESYVVNRGISCFSSDGSISTTK